MNDDKDLARRRAQFEAERQFILERGGRRWIETYIKPYYTQGYAAPDADEFDALLPRLRTLALKLASDDVASMLKMHWRVQRVAAWFAMAGCDPSLSGPVHEGFDHCYGYLTSPCLTAAALVYPNDRAAEVLTRYRDRAIASEWVNRPGVSGGSDWVAMAWR